MTDDSTSRSTEDEESADGDGRTTDSGETAPGDEETAPGDEETPSRESEETPPGDDESADDSPEFGRTDPGEAADPEETASSEPTTDPEPAADSLAEEEMAEAGQSAEDEPTAEGATVAGNPMAGVGPGVDHADSDGFDDSDAGDTSDETAPEGTASDETAPEGAAAGEDDPPSSPADFVPEDVRKYERFKKMDGAHYERVNEFMRDRTYVTAREWAIARLCADFRTETGVEMTKIGENLPRLVPFMNDTYTPQAVNQARASFEEKVRKSGATFLYGAMSGFFTAEQLDDVMYEITEVAKFLLEVEGVDLAVEEELEAEDRILSVMREVREQSEQLRHEGATCPECGHEIGAHGDD